MGIGNKLDTLLKERNMSASELARKVDVAPTTIYSIIQRNNKKVDIDVLLNISDSEYKRLRSAFYSMNRRDDYNDLDSEIENHARK